MPVEQARRRRPALGHSPRSARPVDRRARAVDRASGGLSAEGRARAEYAGARPPRDRPRGRSRVPRFPEFHPRPAAARRRRVSGAGAAPRAARAWRRTGRDHETASRRRARVDTRDRAAVQQLAAVLGDGRSGAESARRQWDRMRVDYALRQHEQWYKGDGVYGDGPEFHWDYYNSFVIHPMLLDVLPRASDEIAGVEGARAARSARGRGAMRRSRSGLGKTLCINPGSSYEQGQLLGAVDRHRRQEEGQELRVDQRLGALPAREERVRWLGQSRAGRRRRRAGGVRSQGDRPRARLVDARRVHLRRVLDQPHHARALHLRATRRSSRTGSLLWAVLIGGGYLVVQGDHLRVADRRDAARRRRLRVDQPRARRRHRLRARRHRLVVHPLALGPDLREHPQRRGARAAVRRSSAGTARVDFLGGHDGVFVASVVTALLASGFIALGMRTYAQDPEVLLLRRPDRPGRDDPAAARQLQGQLHHALQRRSRRTSTASTTPTRRRSRRA